MHADLKGQKNKISSVILEDKGVLLNCFSTVWAPSRASTAALLLRLFYYFISKLVFVIHSMYVYVPCSGCFQYLHWTAFTGQTSRLPPVNGIVLPLCPKSQLQMLHQRDTLTSVLPWAMLQPQQHPEIILYCRLMEIDFKKTLKVIKMFSYFI